MDLAQLKAEAVKLAHPAANVFPMMPDNDIRDLATSIGANGLNHPIVLDAAGLIVDGRNRWVACKLAGIEARTALCEHADVVQFVLDENLHRRHLSDTQRSLIAGRITNLGQGGDRRSGDFKVPNGTLKSAGEASATESFSSVTTQPPVVTVDKAAKMLNVPPRAVKRARNVLSDPEVAQKVDAGEMSLAAGEKAVKAKRKPKDHGATKQSKAKTEQERRVEKLASAPDLRLVHNQDDELPSQVCHLVRQLIGVSEKISPERLMEVFPSSMLHNLRGLSRAAAFLVALNNAYAERSQKESAAG